MKSFKELTEKVDKKIAKKIAYDDGIQVAIHDAIEKHYKGKAHDELDYNEYYDLYSAVAKEVASYSKPGGGLIGIVNKVFGNK